MKKMPSNPEQEALRRVVQLVQSPSHDYHHIARVQEYAEQLAAFLEVDPRLVRIAAVLHDLGRSDPTRRHGIESINASKEKAQSILDHLELTEEERRIVLEAIETHDQPGVTPPTQDGRILKDADFLAGFGAWGVLRIAMWSGESGRRIDAVLHRMTEGMMARFDSLEFDVSRLSALRELLFAQMFCAELARPAQLKAPSLDGSYIVLEGISGAGKNTVAQLVHEQIRSRGLRCKVVEEPGNTFRVLQRALKIDDSDHFVTRALFMADRVIEFERNALPALRRGEIVVSVRSYLSTAVYQARDDVDAYNIMLAHDWLPFPDVIILLDLDAEVALSRIVDREEGASKFETADQLERHRARYLKYLMVFPARRRAQVNAGGSAEEVVEQVMELVDAHLEVGPQV
jgi:dTMP kinase